MKYLDCASLEFYPDKCVTCKRCLEVCPHQVFVYEEGIHMAHKDRCIECGACKMNCPTGAIHVDNGTGCASAVLYTYFKKFKLLRRFFKSSC